MDEVIDLTKDEEEPEDDSNDDFKSVVQKKRSK